MTAVVALLFVVLVLTSASLHIVRREVREIRERRESDLRRIDTLECYLTGRSETDGRAPVTFTEEKK